jgi:hypothetical protein
VVVGAQVAGNDNAAEELWQRAHHRRSVVRQSRLFEQQARSRDIGGRVSPNSMTPVDRDAPTAVAQNVRRMEVAVTQPVTVGERSEDFESSLAYVVGHELRPELKAELISESGQLAGIIDWVEARAYTSERAGDRPHEPWSTIDHGEQVRAIETIEDQPRSSIDRDHLMHRRYGSTHGVSPFEHDRLPVHVLELGIQERKTKHALGIERKHLRFATCRKPHQVVESDLTGQPPPDVRAA